MFTHHAGLVVSAGSRWIAPELIDEVVLDLAGHATPVVSTSGPALLPSVRRYQTFTRIRVDWDDMEAPDLYPRFWDSLIEDIVAGRHNLTIMCFGGHGRTGTALAIVAELLGAIPTNECPIKWVREHYCKEAVETARQARYIEAITGHKVTTKIADTKFTYNTGGTSWKS